MIRIRPIQLLILCGILFVGAIISSSVLLLSNLHRRALTESFRELNNVVLMLSEQTDRAIRATELIEDSLIERMQALGVSSPEDYERMMSGQEMHLFLKEKVAGWPHISSLTLINSKEPFSIFPGSGLPQKSMLPIESFSTCFKPIRRSIHSWASQYAIALRVLGLFISFASWQAHTANFLV